MLNRLEKRFNPKIPDPIKKKIKREKIFKSKQRIHKCLKDLEKINLIVIKNIKQNVYYPNTKEIFLAFLYNKEKIEMEKNLNEYLKEVTYEISKLFYKIEKYSSKKKFKELKDLNRFLNEEIFPAYL